VSQCIDYHDSIANQPGSDLLPEVLLRFTWGTAILASILGVLLSISSLFLLILTLWFRYRIHIDLIGLISRTNHQPFDGQGCEQADAANAGNPGLAI
jgi:hypothetical protein